MKRIILLCLFLCICGCDTDIPLVTEEPVNQQEEVEEQKRQEMIVFFKKQKEINPDYVGWLSFESGIISQPVVLSKDNKEYLNISFEGKKSSQGTVFMDYKNYVDEKNTIHDQNIILYGHLVYYDKKAMFSPLTLLLNDENYEANKMISLQLEDEIRQYQIAYVVYYELNDEKMPYYYTDYSVYGEQYFDYLKEKALYDTGIHIESDDCILTLQTCVRNKDNLRQIVVAKQIY